MSLGSIVILPLPELAQRGSRAALTTASELTSRAVEATFILDKVDAEMHCTHPSYIHRAKGAGLSSDRDTTRTSRPPSQRKTADVYPSGVLAVSRCSILR
jgi:hypothetical protein